MIREFLTGLGAVAIYYIVCAASALLLKRFIRIPNEVFRKLLHFILIGSLLLWLFAFQTWWVATLSAAIFAAVVYPILFLAEKLKNYSQTVTERKKGELKSSLLVVFSMFIVVLSVCWGWLDDRLLALASVYAWGFGDAAAALAGKRFGRHPIEGAHIEGKKSLEGSLSMFAVSFLCVITILLFRGGLAWYGYPVISLVTAAVSSIVELFSLKGTDTITCPLAAMAVLLPLIHLFGGGI